MFAYFQVALGQSGSGNIGVLCLDGYGTMQISNLYEQINIMIWRHLIIHCHNDLFFSFNL